MLVCKPFPAQRVGKFDQCYFRYNSLPNLKGMVAEGAGGSYPSHPRDEEKRIAYTRGKRRNGE